uniref:Pseudouridine synthase II N-terminal domain-containing protein n=1 Tax=Ciona savignyi TaxID=51511 RepID=H2YML1_CIOSA
MSNTPIVYAPRAYGLLSGMLAVYKPAGVGINSLHDKIVTKLVTDINRLEQRPQKQRLLQTKSISDSTIESLVSKTYVPDWSDHPLVTGPRFTNDNFLISFGNLLDADACGVQVIGVDKKGENLTKRYQNMGLPRKYKVHGQFGFASMTHSPKSRILERSTWDHVTADKISRVLTTIQVSHRNAMLRDSGLELSSHQAYKLASRGLLRPKGGYEPVIVDIKLSSLNLPHFVLEIICINDNCAYVRKILHEVAVELRTNAICTKLQVVQDGVFNHDSEHTLLSHQINTNNFLKSIFYYRPLLLPHLAKKADHFKKNNFIEKQNCATS